MRWLLALLIVAAAGRVSAEPRSTSESQLVSDVKELLADSALRPSHVDPPLVSSFGELAEPFLLKLKECQGVPMEEAGDSVAVRKAVLAGDRPLEDLPTPWLEVTKKCGPYADGVLQATHAATGKLPFPLTLFGQFADGTAPYTFAQTQLAVRIAGVEELEAVKGGDTVRAVGLCVDQLALGRDVSHGDLVAQMTGDSAVGIAEPTCLVVLAKATPSQRRQFQAQVRSIEAAWTPMSFVFDQERLFGQIGPFFDSLSPATQAALPPEAHLKLSDFQQRGDSWTQSVRWSLFGAWARRDSSEALDQLAEASKLPPAEGDSRMEALSKEAHLSVLMATDHSGGGEQWVGFVRRVRTAMARMVLLDAVASLRNFHDDHGAWPKTWAELGVGAPVDPRSGLAVVLDARPNGVALVPASDGDRTSEDLSITLH